MYYNILMLVSGAFLITGVALCVVSAVISQQAQQYILLGLGITFLILPVITICILRFVMPLLH